MTSSKNSLVTRLPYITCHQMNRDFYCTHYCEISTAAAATTTASSSLSDTQTHKEKGRRQIGIDILEKGPPILLKQGLCYTPRIKRSPFFSTLKLLETQKLAEEAKK